MSRWWFHPESDCYLRDDDPHETMAMMCVEVDESQVPLHARQADAYYRTTFEKGQSMVSIEEAAGGWWECVHGNRHGQGEPCTCGAGAIEGVATRVAVEGEHAAPAQVAEVVQSEHRGVVNNDALVKTYLKIRDAKAAYKREVEAYVKAAFEAPLKQISTELLRRCQKEGNTGLKTQHGTVYLVEEMKVSCGDWGIFYDWMLENRSLDFLEQRVKAGEVKKYMEEHAGVLPPGLSVFRELEARVRQPKNGSKSGHLADE